MDNSVKLSIKRINDVALAQLTEARFVLRAKRFSYTLLAIGVKFKFFGLSEGELQFAFQ